MIIENAPLFFALGLALIFVLHRRNGNSRPFPPGPKKLPLIGNLLDMPSSFHWITFSQWAKQYGKTPLRSNYWRCELRTGMDIDSDILHLEVAGAHYVVLSSYDAVADLLDKRSSIYSSRPHATMLYDLVGWNRDLLLMSYGEDLKAHRKLFQQEFHPNNSSLHRPHEKKALGVFLKQINRNARGMDGTYSTTFVQPTKVLNSMTGSIILGIAYGIHVQPNNDPDIYAAEKMISVLKIAGLPGAFLVVRYFTYTQIRPLLVSGCLLQAKSKGLEWDLAATITPPFMKAKEAMVNGSAEDCFSLRCLQNAKHPDPRVDFLSEEEEIIKETAGTMYEGQELLLHCFTSFAFGSMLKFFAGGADTGITALRTFILAILNFPDAQREAQEELDRVIGKERLPDYDDKDSLPYITAVTYECFRLLYPFPHRVDTEDIYRGYRIPKDSVVIPNVWGILRDPSIYGPNAHEFEPKRWLIKTNGGEWELNPEMLDPTAISFGFGRRVCPGKHMGLSSLWINIASLLHSFNITRAIGKDGKPIEPRVEYVSSMLNVPAPFECTIKPRSDGHVALVRETLTSELGDK
ncbi:cytochrome P450 [Gymnopus androsaceus JB14]|uniref:Cytochrome P450 n=1 Tax=Gymnopus androsaceus JB14 TaxID=1447944 RepID=A0A6A4HKM9_9AGAR|nr:cytochrome P450 [Gymnopus androsaceus JB14]